MDIGLRYLYLPVILAGLFDQLKVLSEDWFMAKDTNKMGDFNPPSALLRLAH